MQLDSFLHLPNMALLELIHVKTRVARARGVVVP